MRAALQRARTANIISSLLIILILILLYASLFIGLGLVLLHVALHKAEDNTGAEVYRWSCLVVDLFYSPVTPDGYFLISASKGTPSLNPSLLLDL